MESTYSDREHQGLYLVHGEDNAKAVLKGKLCEQGWSTNMPHHVENILF